MSKRSKLRISILIFLILNVIIWFNVLLKFTTLECLKKAIIGRSSAEKKIITHSIKSEFQKGKTEIRVLLPDNMEKGKRYPVLYILPTVPHKFDFWWNSGLIEAAKYNIHNKYKVICVYPTFEKMPWYGDNSKDKKVRQESYLVKYVVPFIDKNYQTISEPDGRMMLGISKSGCGVFTILLRYPDVFGKAASWDAPHLYFDIKKVKGSGLVNVFGTQDNYTKNYYLPTLLIKKASIFQGKDARFVLMGHGWLKDHVEQTHELMKSLNIPHIYDNSKKRKHIWQSGWLPEAVDYLMNEEGSPILVSTREGYLEAKQNFIKLKEQWAREIPKISSKTYDYWKGEAAKKILFMGKKVLPFVMEEIKEGNFFFNIAAEKITKISMEGVSEQESSKLWIEWWEKNKENPDWNIYIKSK